METDPAMCPHWPYATISMVRRRNLVGRVFEPAPLRIGKV